MNISFRFSWVNTQEWDVELYITLQENARLFSKVALPRSLLFCKLHEAKDIVSFHYSCILCLEQCLALRRCLRNVWRMKEPQDCRPPPPEDTWNHIINPPGQHHEWCSLAVSHMSPSVLFLWVLGTLQVFHFKTRLHFFVNLCVSFPLKQIPRSRIAESKFTKDHNFHRSCKKVMPIYTLAESGGDSLLLEIARFATASPTLRMVTWDKCVTSMLLEVSGSSRSGLPRFLDFTCGYTLQKEW